MIFILVHKINVYRHWCHRDAVRGWTACDRAITCSSFPLQRHIKGCIWILPCDITGLSQDIILIPQGSIWISFCDITVLSQDIIQVSQGCIWISLCDITGLYLDIVLWHHNAESGYHPDQVLYLDITLITVLWLDIVLWHHSTVAGYCPVTSQCYIWISFCDCDIRGSLSLSPVLVQYPSYKYWNDSRHTNRCNHVHTNALSLGCGSTSLPGIVALETCTSGKACAHHIL